MFARARSTVRCEILFNGSISATQTSQFSSSCIVERDRLDAEIGAQQQRQHLITVHAPAHTKNDKGDICLLSRVSIGESVWDMHAVFLTMLHYKRYTTHTDVPQIVDRRTFRCITWPVLAAARVAGSFVAMMPGAPKRVSLKWVQAWHFINTPPLLRLIVGRYLFQILVK